MGTQLWFRCKHFVTICVPPFPCPADWEELSPSRTGWALEASKIKQVKKAGARPGRSRPWGRSCRGDLQEEAGSMSWRPGNQGRRGGGGLSQAPSLGAPMKMDTRDVAKGSASPDAWQGPPGRLEGCP